MATKASAATQTKAAGEKTVVVNRQARHDYFIVETFEAGLALTGTEIKSIRAGRVNLREAYARVENGEVWLVGMHIAPYDQAGGYFQHDPLRPRKLLLHRRQIEYLRGQLGQKGLTLVPLRLYLKRGKAKVELGLAKGKKLYDKRENLARRDAEREIERALRTRE
ncbi:MAG TPA: SsrA-binding protein SmpB [Thermomicrobiales bacterium]|nr:SsrA-binding protein SmpB [Thermomicrobiales bacterium]